MVTPDFTYQTERTLGPTGTVGADAFIEVLEQAVALAPDVGVSYEIVRPGEKHIGVIATWSGIGPVGGEIALTLGMVFAATDDGRCSHVVEIDPDPAQIAVGLRAWHGVLRRAAAGI